MGKYFQNLYGGMCFMQTKQEKTSNKSFIRFVGKVPDNDYFRYCVGLFYKVGSKEAQ
jgi:hypothetical protein